MNKPGRRGGIGCWCLVVAMALLGSGRVGVAATLFERSQGRLAEKAERAEVGEYRFVVMGDSKDSDEIFLKALALAVSLEPLFILHLGDISNQGAAADVDHFLQLLAQGGAGVPFFVVRGNHEQAGPFQERVGPLDFVIDTPRLDLKVVAVDNAEAQLTDSRLRYLQAQLAAPRQTNFVAMHIPPATDRWVKHTFAAGAPELLDLLAARRVAAAFYGHIHFYDRDEFKGVPQFITGGAGARLKSFSLGGELAYHILLVRVRGGKAEYEMVRIKE